MKIGVLGAGSWGLTLAWLWAKSDGTSEAPQVWVWDRSPEKIAAYKKDRNVTFPVSVTIPDNVILTDSLAEELPGTQILVLVVTAKGTRETCQQLAQLGLPADVVIVNASKGIELPTLKRLSEVIQEELPRNPQAVLSGPTLAPEILAGLPTAASIACTDLELAGNLQNWLSRENILRLYANPDVTGVELGGALKNVFAISSGYMTAKHMGDNAKAAFLTRGLDEMTRFCVHLGAQEMTLYGLSGLGDLLATSSSPLSRNFQVGYRMAQGKSLQEVLAEIKVVAEGVPTAQAVLQLAEKTQIEMPIVQVINLALFESPSQEWIIKSLMSRKPKIEKTVANL